MTLTIYQPQLIIEPDASAAGQTVAKICQTEVLKRPGITLGLATGSTPIPVYRKIVELHLEGEVDFSQTRTFNLDEYVGLSGDHPQSFRFFMQDQLFRHTNIDANRVHIPDGLADDPDQHAAQYDALIDQSGGIDWQLLGIGSNGHIAFNEPGSASDSRTRVVELTEETIAANARFFDSPDEVPRQAISMGIETICEAKQIVLLATGAAKSEAIAAAIQGPPTEECPASLLQHHQNVTYVLDADAAANLKQISS